MDITTEALTVTFSGWGTTDAVRPTALTDLHLRIDSGERVALVGPSGSGKSTLLRALLGAVPATGRVWIGGMDPFGSRGEVRSIRSSTGFLRQGNDLVLGVSARLNAAMGTASQWGVRSWASIAAGRVPRADAARLSTLAAEHGIASLLPFRVRELSGGERQRVALVRALLSSPSLLLADEPTTGLDPATATAAVDALWAVTEGTTVIVATHDPTVASRFPRTIALRDGRLVHDGSTLDEDTSNDVYGPYRRYRPGGGDT